MCHSFIKRDASGTASRAAPQARRHGANAAGGEEGAAGGQKQSTAPGSAARPLTLFPKTERKEKEKRKKTEPKTERKQRENSGSTGGRRRPAQSTSLSL